MRRDILSSLRSTPRELPSSQTFPSSGSAATADMFTRAQRLPNSALAAHILRHTLRGSARIIDIGSTYSMVVKLSKRAKLKSYISTKDELLPVSGGSLFLRFLFCDRIFSQKNVKMFIELLF